METKKRLIIHHGDADGRCAAAIVRKFAPPVDCTLYAEMQYQQLPPYDTIFSLLPGQDEIWMVDFSLDDVDMDCIARFIGGDHFVWIDHHQTAIERVTLDLPGVRQFDPPKAACLLTWEYLLGDRPPPLAVEYIADRDIWAFTLGQSTRSFYESYRQYDDKSPASAIWDRWIDDRKTVSADLLRGFRLYDARIKDLRTYARRYGRPGKIHGTDHSMLEINIAGNGDMGQVVRDMGYDLAHCYVDTLIDGRLVRQHSVYSEVVHCGHYAAERGGGGHPGAAGWIERL